MRAETGVITSDTLTSFVLPDSMSTSLVVTRPASGNPISPLAVTRMLGYLPAGRPKPSQRSSTSLSVAVSGTTRGSKTEPRKGRWRFAEATAAACSSTVEL